MNCPLCNKKMGSYVWGIYHCNKCILQCMSLANELQIWFDGKVLSQETFQKLCKLKAFW